MPSPVAVLSGDRNMPNEARLPAMSAVSPLAAAVSRQVAMPSRRGSPTAVVEDAHARRRSDPACLGGVRQVLLACQAEVAQRVLVELGELGVMARRAALLGVGDLQPVRAGDDPVQRAGDAPRGGGRKCDG